MDLVDVAVRGILLPALTALFLLAFGGLSRRRTPTSPGVPWDMALALGLGYIVGHVAISRPAWPPIEVTDRVPFLALAALILGTLEAIRPGPGWTRWENRLIFSGLVVVTVLGPVHQENWASRAALLRMGAISLAIVLSWTNLEALAVRVLGAAIVLPLLVVVVGSSVVLLASGSLIYARFGGVLAAAFAPVLVAAWWSGRLSIARGGVPVLTLVLAALLLEGHDYSEAPPVCLLLIAAAPWLIWIERIGPVRRLAPWKAALVTASAVLVPVGVAVGIALANSPAPGY